MDHVIFTNSEDRYGKSNKGFLKDRWVGQKEREHTGRQQQERIEESVSLALCSPPALWNDTVSRGRSADVDLSGSLDQAFPTCSNVENDGLIPHPCYVHFSCHTLFLLKINYHTIFFYEWTTLDECVSIDIGEKNTKLYSWETITRQQKKEEKKYQITTII